MHRLLRHVHRHKAHRALLLGPVSVMLSRTRRVADLVQRLVAAEAALRVAEVAIKDAAGAVQNLRAIAEQGGSKLAP